MEDCLPEEVANVVRRRLAPVAWRGHLSNQSKGEQCRRRSSKSLLNQSISQATEPRTCKHYGLPLSLAGGSRRRQLELTVGNGAFGSRLLHSKTILQDVSAITRSIDLSQLEQIV